MPEKQVVNDVAERAFRRHYGQVYRYIRRRTHDHARAEELTQQVFADAAASLRETAAPTLAWLYTVARRRFADEVRRNARGNTLAIASVPPVGTHEYGPDLAAALSVALARPRRSGSTCRVVSSASRKERAATSMGRSWTGYVVRRGIYVSNETGAGESAILAVARALRPAP